MSKPKIAIVGGIHEQVLKQRDQPQVAEAARTIGRELSRKKCPIVVYSSDERFIEPYVVAGYLEEKLAGRPILCVANENHPIDYPGVDDPDGPFETRVDPNADWEIGFYQSIRDDAEGVLLLGGGPTTLTAGLVAIHAKKALYSVAAFGGAANTAWKYLNANPHVENDVERQRMKHPWQGETSAKHCVDALIRQADVAARKVREDLALRTRLAEMTRLKHQNWPTLGFVLFFLVTLIGSLSALPKVGTWLFWVMLFSVLGTAGVTGSMVRRLWKPILTHPLGTTAVLGTVAGLVVGLSYLVPQLISATLEEESKLAIFLVPALIALSAGYGFDHAFEKWRETSTSDIDRALGAGGRGAMDPDSRTHGLT